MDTKPRLSDLFSETERAMLVDALNAKISIEQDRVESVVTKGRAGAADRRMPELYATLRNRILTQQ